MNEHVTEKMLSHLTDLNEEFRALKIEQPGLQAPKRRSRLTMGGVETQEQSSQEVLLTNFAKLYQEQQTEINGLRGLVNNMTGDLERGRVERPLQELTIRLVRC